MDLTRLITFGASFFFVALSPGLCMTLAMSLGISIGVRRALWMMAGELAGILLVGTAAVVGVAALLLQAPTVFAVFKWIGAAYLVYMGWQTWRSEPPRLDVQEGDRRRSAASLIFQGFITAVSNPKAWAFMVALLPMLALMLVIEFISLQIYAHGGRALSEQLHRRGKARWLNRVAGSLMVGVGIWLALG
jgi:homoserine/homoserine lactone efflux protein